MDIKLPYLWTLSRGSIAQNTYEWSLRTVAHIAYRFKNNGAWRATLVWDIDADKYFVRSSVSTSGVAKYDTPELDTPEAAIAYWEMLYG